jgi:hypothetical protein
MLLIRGDAALIERPTPPATSATVLRSARPASTQRRPARLGRGASRTARKGSSRRPLLLGEGQPAGPPTLVGAKNENQGSTRCCLLGEPRLSTPAVRHSSSGASGARGRAASCRIPKVSARRPDFPIVAQAAANSPLPLSSFVGPKEKPALAAIRHLTCLGFREWGSLTPNARPGVCLCSAQTESSLRPGP